MDTNVLRRSIEHSQTQKGC